MGVFVFESGAGDISLKKVCTDDKRAKKSIRLRYEDFKRMAIQFFQLFASTKQKYFWFQFIGRSGGKYRSTFTQ